MRQPLQRNRLARYGAVAMLVSLTSLAVTYSTPNNAATSPDSAQTELVYVGTQKSQIDALRLDTTTGKLTAIGPVAEGPKSTWVAVHPHLPILYAVDDDNAREGSITAYAVDRGTGTLTRMNAVPTGGNGSTYLGWDTPSMTLFSAQLRKRLRIQCLGQPRRKPGLTRVHDQGSGFRAEPSTGERACAQRCHRSVRSICARPRSGRRSCVRLRF